MFSPCVNSTSVCNHSTLSLTATILISQGKAEFFLHQMRDQFDSGEKTKFTEDDNPHDVAALFKEYFRDLPEPLLTRDLYSAFLETQSKLHRDYRETVYVNGLMAN